jgi:hypothetical protein
MLPIFHLNLVLLTTAAIWSVTMLRKPSSPNSQALQIRRDLALLFTRARWSPHLNDKKASWIAPRTSLPLNSAPKAFGGYLSTVWTIITAIAPRSAAIDGRMIFGSPTSSRVSYARVAASAVRAPQLRLG